MSHFSARVSELLEPLAGLSPCGVNPRHQPIYNRLRQLRTTDDASLPMAGWQSQSQRVDWIQLESIAVSVLLRDSKDLMVAAWLGEAWLQLDARSGITDALSLITGLCERYPLELYPQPQGDDLSWRATPLEWTVRRYTELLCTQFQFFDGKDREFASFGLGDWQQLQRHVRHEVASHGQASAMSAEQDCGEQKRLNERVRSTSLSWWLNSLDVVQAALQQLEALDRWSEHYFDGQGPSYHSLKQTLLALAAVFKEFITQHPSYIQPVEAEEVLSDITIPESTTIKAFREPEDLDDAYRQLLLIADYLTRNEPHSQLPYLIRKGLEWGDRPLKELLEKLISFEAENRRF